MDVNRRQNLWGSLGARPGCPSVSPFRSACAEARDATGRLDVTTPACPQQPPQTTAQGADLFQGGIAEELDPELSWRRRCEIRARHKLQQLH